MSKTLKFTKQQMKMLFSCYLLGSHQTKADNSSDLDNGFVKEKDIKRKHKIMNNVGKKIVKAMK